MLSLKRHRTGMAFIIWPVDLFIGIAIVPFKQVFCCWSRTAKSLNSAGGSGLPANRDCMSRYKGVMNSCNVQELSEYVICWNMLNTEYHTVQHSRKQSTAIVHAL